MIFSVGDEEWRKAAAAANIHPRALSHTPSLLLAAERLKVLGQHRAVELLYREILRRDPSVLEALRGLLALLRIQGRRDEAATCQRQLIEAEVNRVEGSPEQRARLLEYRLATEGLEPAPDRVPAWYVARSFDGYADQFDTHVRESLDYRGPEQVAKVLGKVVKKSRSGLDVLDLGCGTGLAGPILRPLARRLDGLDLSPAMLEKARGRKLYDDLTVGDAVEFPRQRPATYDLVLALEVLNYLGDLIPLMAAVAATIKPCGLFLLTVETAETPGFALAVTGRFVHAPDYVRQVAGAAGFTVVQEKAVSLRKEQGRDVPALMVVLMHGASAGTS